MKYIKELLIAVLLLAVVAFWYNSNNTKDKLKEFDAKEKQLKARLDSIQKLQHQADLHALRVMTDFEASKAKIRDLANQNEKLTKRYYVLKSMAPPNLTDSAISAKVARLYPGR